MRVEPPVLCRASAFSRLPNSSRTLGVASTAAGAASAARPASLRQASTSGKHQRRDIVAVGAGDHRVAHERRKMIDELRAQRARR